MRPQDLFFLPALPATEPAFLRTVRRVAGSVAERLAGFDRRSVFAATDPSVDPIVRAKLISRPSSFLAGLLPRLFCICSPNIPGDMDSFRSEDSHPRRSDQLAMQNSISYFAVPVSTNSAGRPRNQLPYGFQTMKIWSPSASVTLALSRMRGHRVKNVDSKAACGIQSSNEDRI
jgi:hypothetical protein